MNSQDMQTSPSAIVSPHQDAAIIFQGGMLTQALVLTRSDIDRFLLDPQTVDPLVLPSFASAGLACHSTTGKVDLISIVRHPDDAEAYSVAIKLRNGEHVVYYSDSAHSDEPEVLAARGVTIVITPRSIMSVHHEPTPHLSLVASLPQAQLPDLNAPYAAEIELLRDALEEALKKARTQSQDEN